LSDRRLNSNGAFAGSILFAIISIALGALADRIGARGALLLFGTLGFFTVVFYLPLRERKAGM
jgi:hypothetical protein